MKVHRTDTAEGHRDAIHHYIAQDSRQYAKRMVDRLTRRSQQIANHPLSGRRVHEYEAKQIREVVEGPYRIIYHIKPDQIDVIAVIHAAMESFAPLTTRTIDQSGANVSVSPVAVSTLIYRTKELYMFREEVAKVEELAERINKLRGSL